MSCDVLINSILIKKGISTCSPDERHSLKKTSFPILLYTGYCLFCYNLLRLIVGMPLLNKRIKYGN